MSGRVTTNPTARGRARRCPALRALSFSSPRRPSPRMSSPIARPRASPGSGWTTPSAPAAFPRRLSPSCREHCIAIIPRAIRLRGHGHFAQPPRRKASAPPRQCCLSTKGERHGSRSRARGRLPFVRSSDAVGRRRRRCFDRSRSAVVRQSGSRAGRATSVLFARAGRHQRPRGSSVRCASGIETEAAPRAVRGAGLSHPGWLRQCQILAVERPRRARVEPAIVAVRSADRISAGRDCNRGVRVVDELRGAGIAVAAPAVPL